MLFRIYLGISILTFVLYTLQNFSLQNKIKRKYANKIKEKLNKKKDISGIIFSWLRLVVLSFIPIYNILLLLILIFKSDEIMIEGEKQAKEALYNED